MFLWRLALVSLLAPFAFSKEVFVPVLESSLYVENSVGCAESVWCDHSRQLQAAIREWQNPTNDGCSNSKFLLYDPPNYGIGSMIHLAAMGLAVALCSGRILYLHPQTAVPPQTLWRSRNCESTSLECYFKRVTRCRLPDDIINAAPTVTEENAESLRDVQVVRMSHFGEGLDCRFCSSWTALPILDKLPERIRHHFTGSELPLMAQLVRYILRPKPKINYQVLRFIDGHFVKSVPRPFASIHVRYGDKYLETPRTSLDTYVDILRAKAPHIKEIFLSTETEWVLTNMTNSNPDLNFHWFHFKRIDEVHPVDLPQVRREEEFIAAIANLYVAIEADFFVGSLSSNWCRLIHELERTRGDAGFDYHTVDTSQHTRCGYSFDDLKKPHV